MHYVGGGVAHPWGGGGLTLVLTWLIPKVSSSLNHGLLQYYFRAFLKGSEVNMAQIAPRKFPTLMWNVFILNLWPLQKVDHPKKEKPFDMNILCVHSSGQMQSTSPKAFPNCTKNAFIAPRIISILVNSAQQKGLLTQIHNTLLSKGRRFSTSQGTQLNCHIKFWFNKISTKRIDYSLGFY